MDYASSWYGFFNIDVSQIELPPPTILIDGIPAIAVALFVLGLSILITITINIIRHRPNLSRLDTPLLVFFSVGILTIFIFLLQRFLYPIVTLETYVINGTIKYESKMVDNISVTSLGFFNHVFFAVIIPLLCILLLLILATNILTKSKLQRPSSTEKIYKLLQQFIQNWKLWGCILLLVYLFMPMILSSEIGKIDALRGRHLMSGTYLLPSVEIHSDSPIPTMQKIENKSDVSSGYDYGPLLLVYSDSNTYYLAENIPGQTYYDSPNTYYVQRTNSNNVAFIVKSKISLLTEINEINNGMRTTDDFNLEILGSTPTQTTNPTTTPKP